MHGQGFDGIAEVVLPVTSLERAVELYRDLLGFTVTREGSVPAEAEQLWGLPGRADREVLLTKPGATGGAVRLVSVPALTEPGPAGAPDRVGPYALDFYLRDAAAVEARLEAAGRRFVAPPVDYHLPGTTIPVRERMLVAEESGLLHACVQHRPRGTRCVLDASVREDASEVVAVVFLTDAFTDARAFARDVLGGQEYFVGRFDGPAVERMLDLPAGDGFVAALYRGPTSGNARLEFGEVIPGRNRPRDSATRVVARVEVDDLDRLEAVLRRGAHGRVTARVSLEGRDHLGLASRYGAVFDFTQRQTPDSGA